VLVHVVIHFTDGDFSRYVCAYGSRGSLLSLVEEATKWYTLV